MIGDIAYAVPLWGTEVLEDGRYATDLVDESAWVTPDVVKDSEVRWVRLDVNMAHTQHHGFLRRGSRIVNSDGHFRARSFYDLFYDRIHYDPAELALGQLLNAQVRTFSVWNGFLSNRVMQDMVGQDDEGVVLDLGQLPYTFGPLEERTYPVSVSVQGPPVINALFTFTWDHKVITFRVTGNRIVVLAFPPNPRKKYQELLTFYGSIITSYAGVEQRAALADNPKVDMTFAVQVMDEEIQRFEAEMWGWQNRSFAVPIWSSYTYLSQTAAQGSTTLFVEDTSYREFFFDTVAMVYAGPDMFEAVEVLDVAPDRITLKKPLQRGWQGRVHVIPCRTMRMSSEVSFEAIVNNFKEFSLTMHKDVEEVQGNWMVEASYLDAPVLTIEPDSGQSGTYTRNQAFQDGQYSLPIVIDRSGVGTPDFSYTFTFTSREEQQQFKAFLAHLHGAVKEFWFPTWSPDFTLYRSVQEGEFALQVVPSEHSTMYFDRRGRDHLVIIFKDGRQIYRRITSAVRSAELPTEAISLDEPLPRIDVHEVKLISFLGRCRFVNNQFTFDWSTGDYVSVATTIRNLTDGLRPS